MGASLRQTHRMDASPAAGLLKHLIRDDWRGSVIDEHCIVLSPRHENNGGIDPMAVALRILEGVRNPSMHPIQGRQFDLRHVSLATTRSGAVLVLGVALSKTSAFTGEAPAVGTGLALRAVTKSIPLHRLADIVVSRQGGRLLVAIVAREVYFLAALNRAIRGAVWASVFDGLPDADARLSMTRDVHGLRALLLEFSSDARQADVDGVRRRMLEIAVPT